MEWEELHKKRQFNLQPFLPVDNDEVLDGEFDWAEHASEALGELLRMRFPRFASHALFDAELHAFLDSFLRHCRRPYDDDDEAGAPAAARGALARRVLRVLWRASPPPDEETARLRARGVDGGDGGG